MQQKRGISPLIASVLLIAFVILLFILISTWIRRSAVEPTMEVGEGKIASTLECISTNIDIIDVCKNTDDTLKINVDNIGDTTLIGVGIRVIGLTSSSLEEISDDVPPYDRLSETTTIKYSTGTYGNVDTWKIEIYPKISTGICKESMATFSSVTDCSS